MKKLQSKLPDVETSIFSVMSAMANEVGAINLSQGFPDFPIDIELKKKVIEGLAAEQVQYAPMPGRIDLRIEIANKMAIQHQAEFNPLTDITITSGATQAIYSTLTAFINNGDEVILFDPAYDCYAPSVLLNGGVPIHLELKHPTYHIDWDEVEAHISGRTRMLIINNPHNPTGAVLCEEDFDKLEKIVLANPNLLVLSDEVYEHMQYGSTHLSVLKRKSIYNQCIATYSFGKTFHATGWKLGYAVAPEHLTNEIRKVHQYQVFAANNTMQYAIAAYLKTDQNWQGTADFYQQKRNLFLKEMKGSRLKPLACDGTYFMLFDYSEISQENDVDFAKRITEEFKVATIPVSVFYKKKTDHKVIRICFAKKDETLVAAAKILKQL
ncbi:MAG: methionine aminotransferase [Putridiphycobacter sp.]|nr:methionine aminotransferase [Putridiphycobacter sp.]